MSYYNEIHFGDSDYLGDSDADTIGTITIEAIDQSYLKIHCNEGTVRELDDFFKYRQPNYFFMPAYKIGKWDGYIRLFNSRNQTLYRGLLFYLKYFCKTYNYKLILKSSDIDEEFFFSEEQYQAWLNTLTLPFEPRDYQKSAFTHCLKAKRCVIESATGSGKSFVIYLLSRFFCENKKVLIIVPTVDLVHQMVSDFESYSKDDVSFDSETYCHKIFAGKDKNSNTAKIFCSTWQSLYKLDKKYFDQFDVVVGDECHLGSANSIKSILEKCSNAEFRFGFTGTLQESKVHKLTIQGLFGKAFVASKSKELMEKGHLSNLTINCLNLKYTDEECKLMCGSKSRKEDAPRKVTYKDEIAYINSHKKRNNFVSNLALHLTGNTLLMFQYVEKHGKILHKLLEEKLEKYPNKTVFFIHGKVDAEIREEIRYITDTFCDADYMYFTVHGRLQKVLKTDKVPLADGTEKLARLITGLDKISKSWIHNIEKRDVQPTEIVEGKEAIIIGSTGTMSTGINIKNLHNIIFASPTKSKIKTLQSIGRALRIGDSDKAVLYDIVDDFSYKSSKNYALKHFLSRVEIYNSEKFKYNIVNIKI